MRNVVYALLALLYVLHNDVWYWNDPTLTLGLPIGITYHVLWTLAVSGCFWLAVQYAWPDELETAGEPQPGAADEGPGAPRQPTPAVTGQRRSPDAPPDRRATTP